MRSVRIPWYQKPLLHNNKYVNIQKSAMIAALSSVVSCADECVYDVTMLVHFGRNLFMCGIYPQLREPVSMIT